MGSNKHTCMKFYLQDHYVPLNVLVSVFFCKYVKSALDVTADVIVETTCNADMLTINASEDFQ